MGERYRRERSLKASNCRRASPVSSSKAANMTELRVVGELADDSSTPLAAVMAF